MSLRYVDMDKKEEYKVYRKQKKHEKFVKENQEASKTEASYEVPEEPEVKPENEIPSTPELMGKVIKIDMLRLRNYPEGDIIKLLPRNTEVTIVSDHDDIWYKVETSDGTIGYCMKEFLETYFNGEVYGFNDSRRCKTCPTL